MGSLVISTAFSGILAVATTAQKIGCCIGAIFGTGFLGDRRKVKKRGMGIKEKYPSMGFLVFVMDFPAAGFGKTSTSWCANYESENCKELFGGRRYFIQHGCQGLGS